MRVRIVIIAVISLSCFYHQSLAADKTGYHLLNPTPKKMLRDMSTDRPDKTESPYTVDAGHFQLETSLLDYAYNARNEQGQDLREDNLSFMPTNLKAGLLNNVDLQLVMSPAIVEHNRTDGEKSVTRGFGDMQTRLKVNLWGNDAGATAFAMMPYLKFPTNTDGLGNKAYEGGLILPLAVSLPAQWSMGLMAQFDWKRNEEKDYYTDFIKSITFGHPIIGDLNGYVEFFSSYNNEADTRWIGTVDLGLTYAVTSNMQLDAGVNIGVTDSADDLNPFLGLSVRY